MRREGFSLIELLVALVVAAICTSIAAGVFTTVTDAVRSMARRAAYADGEADGLVWLHQAFLGAVVSTNPEDRFRGNADSVAFRTMLPVPAGWTEPVRLTATLERGRLVLRTDRQAYVLPDSLASASFDYLTEYGAESPWLSSFESATAAPLAVRLRREGADRAVDTTLFYVGRGQ